MCVCVCVCVHLYTYVYTYTLSDKSSGAVIYGWDLIFLLQIAAELGHAKLVLCFWSPSWLKVLLGSNPDQNIVIFQFSKMSKTRNILSTLCGPDSFSRLYYDHVTPPLVVQALNSYLASKRHV